MSLASPTPLTRQGSGPFSWPLSFESLHLQTHSSNERSCYDRVIRRPYPFPSLPFPCHPLPLTLQSANIWAKFADYTFAWLRWWRISLPTGPWQGVQLADLKSSRENWVKLNQVRGSQRISSSTTNDSWHVCKSVEYLSSCKQCERMSTLSSNCIYNMKWKFSWTAKQKPWGLCNEGCCSCRTYILLDSITFNF